MEEDGGASSGIEPMANPVGLVPLTPDGAASIIQWTNKGTRPGFPAPQTPPDDQDRLDQTEEFYRGIPEISDD